ncbi:probable serine/threonine-protein kinase kinX isoform X1 [Etheostoma spectabile]|uniref:probable serine/threonine-protein kinase kinX isoform X1 n=1 Tax=Etheostoma spectabile TaxID=54343 RepID=UPI0013AF1D1E|nr:probable serine/threonine-protein kinase kinX isoform X1 [Etheostoma spectabile]
MERRISTRNRNTPKYKDYDEEDEEEQEEEEEYPEDDEQPGTSTQNTPNKRAQDDRLLPVSCGKRNGTLHVKKLYRGEECIESEGRWFSPGAFEDFGGKAASKKWKTSISYKKKPLQFLFEQGLLNTRGFKKRRAETMKQKKIPSRNCISESQSEESDIQSKEESEEDEDEDVKDDNWFRGSEELTQESEEEGEERVGVKDGGDVVDSGVNKSKGEKDEIGETENEDMTPVAENDKDIERETNVTLSTSAKNELQKEVKVVLKRLSELQTTRDCHPSGTEHPLEDSWCTPLDGDADSEEEREHSGSAKDDPIDPSRISDPPIVWGQSNERKDGHRETKTGTPLCAPVASAPDIQPEILNKPDDAGSTCNHTAELRISPVLLVPHGAINIRDVATNTEPIQRDATSSGHDAALLKVIKTEKRFPQASDSTQPSDTVEAPISTQSDLDTMDLDQLKREKIIMQLKVLKLQDEYYTLKIKELKK